MSIWDALNVPIQVSYTNIGNNCSLESSIQYIWRWLSSSQLLMQYPLLSWLVQWIGVSSPLSKVDSHGLYIVSCSSTIAHLSVQSFFWIHLLGFRVFILCPHCLFWFCHLTLCLGVSCATYFSHKLSCLTFCFWAPHWATKCKSCFIAVILDILD